MAVYVVGDFLRETRLRRGYTQEEVSYGICTPASLSRIENGAQKPGRLILEKLFERLGTENNLFNSFVSREEMELYSAIQSLIRDITDEDVAKLEEHISIVEISNKRFGIRTSMFIFCKRRVGTPERKRLFKSYGAVYEGDTYYIT